MAPLPLTCVAVPFPKAATLESRISADPTGAAARMPTAFPTGAVLPQHGLTIGDGSACLALVSVDYVWYPLSEAAAWSYSHAARLHRAEAAVFVPLATSVRSWPYALSATLGDPLQKEQVRTVYGEEAFDRARSDFPTVQVTLRSVS